MKIAKDGTWAVEICSTLFPLSTTVPIYAWWFWFYRKQERQMARHFAIVSHEPSTPLTEDGKGVVGDAVRHQKAQMLGRGIKSVHATEMLRAFIWKCHRICVYGWNGSRHLGFRLSGFRVLSLCLIVIGWSEPGTSPEHCLDSDWALSSLCLWC